MNGALANLGYRLKSMLRRPRFDLPLAGALLLLALVGLATQYSASDLDVDQAIAQGLRLLLGTVLMIVISRIPPSTLRNWTPWLFAGSVLLLILVTLLGEGRGANRWLDLRVVRFQPSELLKVVLVVFLAAYLADNRSLLAARSTRVGASQASTATVSAICSIDILPIEMAMMISTSKEGTVRKISTSERVSVSNQPP